MSDRSDRAKQERYLSMRSALAARYPLCFGHATKLPLKIGIYKDLVAEGFRPFEVAEFLKKYVDSYQYYKAILRESFRCGLQGVTDEVIDEGARVAALNRIRWMDREQEKKLRGIETRARRAALEKALTDVISAWDFARTKPDGFVAAIKRARTLLAAAPISAPDEWTLIRDALQAYQEQSEELNATGMISDFPQRAERIRGLREKLGHEWRAMRPRDSLDAEG